MIDFEETKDKKLFLKKYSVSPLTEDKRISEIND